MTIWTMGQLMLDTRPWRHVAFGSQAERLDASRSSLLISEQRSSRPAPCEFGYGPIGDIASGRPCDRRRRPSTVQDFILRCVEAQHQCEWPFGNRQPVRLLLCAGGFGLNIKVQRSVRIESQFAPIADSLTVQGVRNEIALAVIGGQRPEAFDWRKFALIKMQDASIGAIKRSPLSIG